MINRDGPIDGGSMLPTLQSTKPPLNGLQAAESYASDAILTRAIGGIGADTTLASLEALSTVDLLKELFKDPTLWQSVPALVPTINDDVAFSVTLAAFLIPYQVRPPGDLLFGSNLQGTYSMHVNPGAWNSSPTPYSDQLTPPTELTALDPAHLSITSEPTITLNNGVDTATDLGVATANPVRTGPATSSTAGYTYVNYAVQRIAEDTANYPTASQLRTIVVTFSKVTLGSTALVYDDKGGPRTVPTFDVYPIPATYTWNVYLPVYKLAGTHYSASSTVNQSETTEAIKLYGDSIQPFVDETTASKGPGTTGVQFTMDANGAVYLPHHNGTAPNYVNLFSTLSNAWTRLSGVQIEFVLETSPRHSATYTRLRLVSSNATSVLVRVGYGIS